MSETRPRLFVIGGGGFVGSWVARRAAARCEVIEGVRRPSPSRPHVAIDITSAESVRAAFDEARPDAVILTAALADIDRCEREPGLAEAVNYQGPLNVARECRRRGARLVFTSTDAVFDGTLREYPEHATPSPVNVYGRTKARAEAAIQELLPAATILRYSLVLGFAAAAGTNSYLNKLAETLRAGRTVRVPTAEYRNPIDVTTLADLLVELADREAPGIFHVGSSDKMSRYELAQAIARELRAAAELIEPQTEAVPGRAPRGVDDFLVCERLPRLLGFVPPTCRQVIEKAVHGTS
jgi:dTDP-4-dehydrorhamnose reductase